MRARGGLLQFPHAVAGELFVKSGLILLLLLCAPGASRAESDGDTAPSAALLEFLGEIEPVDEETWRLLEHHAQQDTAKSKEVKNE